jgi:AcrR family transcriptional regulator
VPDKPFHHGNLRAELLDRAEVVLRERGVDALSLRELARHAGVSHGAPRSHFIDRNALLDALAERGFEKLDGAIGQAARRDGDSVVARVRGAAMGYLDFAAANPALLDLMFAAKADGRSSSIDAAATRLFGTIAELLQEGVAAGVLAAGARRREPARFTLLVSSLFQGIATMHSSGRVDRARAEQLVDDAIDLLRRQRGR